MAFDLQIQFLNPQPELLPPGNTLGCEGFIKRDHGDCAVARRNMPMLTFAIDLDRLDGLIHMAADQKCLRVERSLA